MRKHYDVIIFDGNNTAHKSYHINKDLSVNVDGEQMHTGTIFGFLNMLSNIYVTFSNSEIIDKKVICNTRVYVCWDSKDASETNRRTYTYYKENRKAKTIEELRDKLNFDKIIFGVKGVLGMLNIVQLEKAEVEADDIIATLSTKLANKGKSVLIVTEDKDYRQLISDKINLYGITQRLIWDEQVFSEKTGLLKPSHFVDYLAICGDSIDGFIGVSNFGPQKAMALLTDPMFSDKDDITQYILKHHIVFNEFEGWSEKVKESFLDKLHELEQGYKLAKLDTNIKRAKIIIKKHCDSISMFESFCRQTQMWSILKNLDVFKDIFNSTKYWKNHKDVV